MIIIETEDFKSAAKKILAALSSDRNINSLELVARDDKLYTNTTNREFYASVAFPLKETAEFRAVVEAQKFLSIVSAIDSETFSLETEGKSLKLWTETSSYTLPMVYNDADELVDLPAIRVDDASVEMRIGLDVLQGILNYNTKEISKFHGVDTNELQKLYYITETGCFTFTTGACLFRFSLEKPVQLLLNERVVKLFKLFDSGVDFAMGHGVSDAGRDFTTISLTNGDVYISALVNNDDRLLQKMKRPCEKANEFVSEGYDYRLTVDTASLRQALSRLSAFSETKPSQFFPIEVSYEGGYLTFSSDHSGLGREKIKAENAVVETPYIMHLNLTDLVAVVDSARVPFISLDFGNHKTVIATRGQAVNMIPELRS